MLSYFTNSIDKSIARGWDPLRTDDMGILWEHVVLEYLQARFPDATVRYWRDKTGHEVDFVIGRGRDEVDAIECKWSSDAFDSIPLRTFRTYYPKGRNYLVTPSAEIGYTKMFSGLEVRICPPSGVEVG